MNRKLAMHDAIALLKNCRQRTSILLGRYYCTGKIGTVVMT
jgi:hypothetical protein